MRFLKDKEEYEKLSVGKKYSFKCIRCHKECTTTKKSKNYQPNQLKFLCRNCLKQETLKNRYGNNIPKRKMVTEEEKQKANLKRVETLKEKYGVTNATYLSDHNQKVEQTSLQKYGVINVAQLQSTKNKIKQSNLQKYGVEYYTQSKEYKRSITNNKEQISKNIKNGKIKAQIKEKEELEKYCGNLLTIKEVSEKLNKDFTGVYLITKQLNLRIDGKQNCYLKSMDLDILKNVYSTFGISNEEKEVVEFIKNIYKGQIIKNDRKVLNGKELDIYIPEKNLAIEFDGLYWHSDKVSLQKTQIPTKNLRIYAKNRHLEKTRLCEEKGIKLIHIFEDNWIFKKEIVKDIIKKILNTSDIQTINLNQCEVKIIDLQTYKNFLDENHLLGYSFADIRIGLFYQSKLIECIGINSKGSFSKSPEIIRFCLKKGYMCPDSFNRLLKYSNLSSLIMYVDKSLFNNKKYFQQSGFKIIKENPPTYFYINLNHNPLVRLPRYTYMRKDIKRKFEEKELKYFNEKETEEINMYKNGFARIWNCGTIKVQWIKN